MFVFWILDLESIVFIDIRIQPAPLGYSLLQIYAERRNLLIYVY